MLRHTVAVSVILFAALFCAVTITAQNTPRIRQSANPVTNAVNLLGLIAAGDVDFHTSPQHAVRAPADRIFQMRGRDYGYAATCGICLGYHPVPEFKRGERTGNADDIYVVNQEECRCPCSVTIEVARDCSGKRRLRPSTLRQYVKDGRVREFMCGEARKDTRGFTGQNEIETHFGSRNRLEVIAKGDTLRYLLNGWLVNESTDVSRVKGKDVRKPRRPSGGYAVFDLRFLYTPYKPKNILGKSHDQDTHA